jgi:hypothetical protein
MPARQLFIEHSEAEVMKVVSFFTERQHQSFSPHPVMCSEPLKGWKAVFRIHDSLVWIRIRGSMSLTNGYGSGSCYFRHWPSRHQQKTNLKKKFFCLLLFEGVHLHHFFQI